MQVIRPQLDGVKINKDQTLPTALLQAIRKAYDYIAQVPDPSTPGMVIEDLHANRLTLHPAANEDLGTFYLETDRKALYVVQVVKAANTWVLLLGSMIGLLAARPADLGANDAGFFYSATDALDYRWNGTSWVVLDTVRGASTLTDVNRVTKVSATGAISESTVTEDGSTLTVPEPIMVNGVALPTVRLQATSSTVITRIGQVMV
jgi:hypothetical protein